MIGGERGAAPPKRSNCLVVKVGDKGGVGPNTLIGLEGGAIGKGEPIRRKACGHNWLQIGLWPPGRQNCKSVRVDIGTRPKDRFPWAATPLTPPTNQGYDGVKRTLWLSAPAISNPNTKFSHPPGRASWSPSVMPKTSYARILEWLPSYYIQKWEKPWNIRHNNRRGQRDWTQKSHESYKHPHQRSKIQKECVC